MSRSSSQNSFHIASKSTEQFTHHPFKTFKRENVVDAVAFSYDGETLMAGGWDHKVALYSVVNGGLRQEIDRGEFIRTVAASPNEAIFALGGNDEKVALYDTETGHLLQEKFEGEKVRTVAFSPDGKILAVGGRNKKTTLYNVPSFDTRCYFERSEWVFAVAFSPDGQKLAVGGDDAKVALYDVNSERLLSEEIERGDYVRTVVFLPDGTKLAVGGHDKKVALYDVSTNTRLPEIDRHGHVYALAVSPDEKTLAVGGHDRRVALYDLPTYDLRSDNIECATKVRAVAFSRKSQTLAVGCYDGTVALYDVAITQQLVAKIERRAWVNSVTFCKGNVLALGGQDKLVSLYDIAEPDNERLQTERTDYIRTLAVSPDGAKIAVGGEDGKVAVYNVQPSELKQEHEWIQRGGGKVHTVAFSPDGTRLVVGGNNKKVSLYNCSDFASPLVEFERSDAVRTAAFSLDSKTLAVGGEDRQVALYDVVKTPQLLKEIERGGTVRALAFSPDYKTLAMGGDDNEVAFCHTLTREVWSEKIGLRHSVRSVAFSPDGKTLAVGGRDISLLEVATATLLVEVQLTEACHHVAFCPSVYATNGSIVLAIGMGSLVSLVEIRNGARLPIEWLLEHANNEAAVLAATKSFPQAGSILLPRAIHDEKTKLVEGLILRNPAHALDNTTTCLFDFLHTNSLRDSMHCIFTYKGYTSTTPIAPLEQMSKTLLKLAKENITASVAEALKAGGKGAPPGFIRIRSNIFELNSDQKPVSRELPPLATDRDMCMSDWPDEDGRSPWPGTEVDKNKQVCLVLLRVTLPDLNSFEALKVLTRMDGMFALKSLRSVIESHWTAWARRRFCAQCVLYLIWLGFLTALTEIAFEKRLLSRRRRVWRYMLDGGVLVGVFYFGRRELWQARELCGMYVYDMWNWRQWAGLGASICFVIVDVAKPKDESAIAVAGAFALLLAWSGLVHYARGSDKTAPIVSALLTIAWDMRAFVFVLFLCIITFAFALRALFSNQKRADECYYEEDGGLDCDERESGFGTILESFVTTMYAGVFGDFDIDVIYEFAEIKVLTLVVTTLMLLVTLLIALNALISLMTESYTRISSEKDAVLAHQKAKLILELYCDMSKHDRKVTEDRYRWTYVLLPEAELKVHNGTEPAELMQSALALSKKYYEEHSKKLDEVRADLERFKKIVKSELDLFTSKFQRKNVETKANFWSV